MPFQTGWYAENRVILTTVSGTYKTQELRECIQMALELIRQGHPPVHHVVDLRKNSSYPTTVREFIRQRPPAEAGSLSLPIPVGRVEGET